MSVVNPLPCDYTAYGLHVRSPIVLPFAPLPGRPGGAPDVVIRFSPTPAALPAPVRTRQKPGRRWESASGTFLMNVDGEARYLVTGGRDVLIEPRGGSDSEIVELLTGSVFAALLQQRGVMTFHASALETQAGAVLFAGPSGIGKSSLAASLVERGHTMLADDVTGVVLDAGGRPVALSASPVVRLWADAVHALDRRGRTRGRVRESVEKHSVPVERFRAAPLAVRAVCVLASHDRDGIEVERLRASGAFRHMFENTYRRAFLSGLGQRPVHVRTLVAMAKRVPILRMVRPAHPFRLDALVDRIEELLAAGGGSGEARRPGPAAAVFRHRGWTGEEGCP